MKRYKVTVTTAADGSATAYSPRLSGLLHQISYVKDGGANPFADGVDFTITDEATGTRAPRQATHTQAGVAATLDGTVAALDKVALANSRIKIILAQGGNAKVGAFHFLVG
jgi:hypothetical protein